MVGGAALLFFVLGDRWPIVEFGERVVPPCFGFGRGDVEVRARLWVVELCGFGGVCFGGGAAELGCSLLPESPLVQAGCLLWL